MKVFDPNTAPAAAVSLQASIASLVDELSWRLSYAEGLSAYYSRTRDQVEAARFAKIGTVLADLRHGLAAIA
jgi:hypothetical protein